jgi:hypothetical protein
MTANAGKGAGGKPGKRPTGASASSGGTRKKASAAKQPSDEVTLRTNADGDESKDDAEETVVVDAAGGEEHTVRDATPSDDAERDNDATMIDGIPAIGSSSFSSSSSEEPSSRTATFGLPKDSKNSDSVGPESDASGTDPWAIEPSKPADTTKKSQESGVMPSSGRSAAMDSSTSSSQGYGGDTSASGTPSYAPSGSPTSSDPKAIGSRVSKLAGALRKPEKSDGRKPPRKAHLQVARFEPWSVMKFSFIMSLVCFLVLFVAVVVLYVILSWLGVFDALSSTIRDLTSNDQGKSGGLNPASWFSAARILGYTALIGTLNVLLITALATVWSVIYNMASDLVGGVEVTLKESDG